MSMIGNLVAISPQELETFVAAPDSLPAFLYPDDSVGDPANHLDIDKAWHAIHYLLNGKTWEGEAPLFHTILGGEEIGEDVGYGPSRFLTPSQVKAIASELIGLTPDAVGARFEPTAMDAAEIYPQTWTRDGKDGWEYVRHYYEQLREFYLKASERGDAVLLYVN